MPRWWLRCLVVASVGLALTLVVALGPALRFAYRAPVLRAILETSVTIVGALVAFLVVGRYRRRRRVADLAIAGALAILALSYPLFVAVPIVVPGDQLEDFGSWMYLVARVCAAGLLWWASGRASDAWLGDLPRHGHLPGRVYAASAAALASIVLLRLFAPDPDDSVGRQALTGPPHPFSEPVIASIQLVCFLLFIGAAAQFSRQRSWRDDPLFGWLSVGCVFIAVASLDYGLFPTLNRDQLHVGDVFRVAAVLVFAAGASGEIRSYWSESRRLARLEERRRVARDLHDGIAQELAFLRAHVHEDVGRTLDEVWLHQLRAATDRALAESRRAIAALIADQPLALRGDLEETARQIASPAGASLELDIQPSSFDPDTREVLIRIVREAVINAVRHGRAKMIRIHLGGDDQPVLRVTDDGAGFDASTAEIGGGFGLISMREHAHSIGARFAVQSVPGEGTTVEVSWAAGNPNAS